MASKIIVKGYYGFGNFGDDILLLTTYHWVQLDFPEAEIMICTDSRTASYLSILLGKPVTILQSHQNIQADWIIHGGGGVYFDFKSGGWKYHFLNTVIKIIGPHNFRKLYQSYRVGRGTSGISGNLRVALGIGVGTYTPSSQRFYADIQELLDFKLIVVRDADSVNNLKHLGVSCPVKIASDLAFVDSYWKPTGILSASGNRTVGFILRDWSLDNHQHIHALKVVADELVLKGFEVQFFSFDRFSDAAYIEHIQNDYPIVVWNPFEQTLLSFLQKLNTCTLVITSRAHGAIVASVLGIPSICLEIEPKLAQVATLLQRSSALLKKPFKKENVLEVVLDRMQKIDALRRETKIDQKTNKQIMTEALETCRQFLKQEFQPR